MPAPPSTGGGRLSRPAIRGQRRERRPRATAARPAQSRYPRTGRDALPVHV